MRLGVSIEMQRFHSAILADGHIIVIPQRDLAIDSIPIPEASDIEPLVVASGIWCNHKLSQIRGEGKVLLGSLVVDTEVPIA